MEDVVIGSDKQGVPQALKLGTLRTCSSKYNTNPPNEGVGR